MTDAPKGIHPAVKAGGVGLVILAGVALATNVSAPFEGDKHKPYRDPVGIETVCYGETSVPMREYSEAECQAMLKARQTGHFAPIVLAAVPAFADPANRNPFGASIDFSYNEGGFRNTAMAKAFRAGEWQKGADAFLLYRFAHKNGRLVELPGLLHRRRCERALAMGDAGGVRQFCEHPEKIIPLMLPARKGLT